MIKSLYEVRVDKMSGNNQSIMQKKIIVTGASKGIGRQMVKEIAVNGGTPIAVARSKDLLEELQIEMGREGYSCKIYPIEYFSSETIDAQIQEILEKEKRVHGLINNAGFGVFASIETMGMEEMEEMFQVNVFAGIQYTKLLLPHFQQFKGKAHIINIVSQAAKIPTPKSAGYTASKQAMLAFTNVLRQELASQHISVTAVNLGPVKTSFFDRADKDGTYQKNVEKYMLEPEQVATKVVSSLFSNRREINLPWWMEAGSVLYRLFPGWLEKLLKPQFNKKG